MGENGNWERTKSGVVVLGPDEAKHYDANLFAVKVLWVLVQNVHLLFAAAPSQSARGRLQPEQPARRGRGDEEWELTAVLLVFS